MKTGLAGIGPGRRHDQLQDLRLWVPGSPLRGAPGMGECACCEHDFCALSAIAARARSILENRAVRLGVAHAARREYAVQESLLVRAIAADAEAPALHTRLALALVNQGKYDEARGVVDRAERRFPGMRGRVIASIAIAAAKQDWEVAEREFLRAIELNPSHSVTRLWYANALLAFGRFDDVLEQGRRALELDPLSMINHLVMAWAYLFQGRFEAVYEKTARALDQLHHLAGLDGRAIHPAGLDRPVEPLPEGRFP